MMKNPTRVFIHGLESTSQGTKGIFFRTMIPDMIIEDYEGTLKNRMTKLDRMLVDRNHLILVGSSYGGLMAAMYACTHPEKVESVVLLAPALNLPDFNPFLNRRLSIPVSLFHGQNDDVIPSGIVREIAVSVFSNLRHHIVDDDHSLHQTFPTMPWKKLLNIEPISRPS